MGHLKAKQAVISQAKRGGRSQHPGRENKGEESLHLCLGFEC